MRSGTGKMKITIPIEVVVTICRPSHGNWNALTGWEYKESPPIDVPIEVEIDVPEGYAYTWAKVEGMHQSEEWGNPDSEE